MLDQVKVDYYGTQHAHQPTGAGLHAEAQLMPDRLPWDPASSRKIDKALRTADLGFNPISDGKLLPRARSAHDRGAPPRGLQAPETACSRSTDGGSECPPRTATKP